MIYSLRKILNLLKFYKPFDFWFTYGNKDRKII